MSNRLDPSLIARLPPFSKLDRDQITTLLEQATSQLYPAETTIFSEGQEAERFFLLLDGHIRVVRLTPGGEQVIALHIPPGQLFGIAQAIGRKTYPAMAVAAEDCIALSWPVNLWQRFCDDFPGFATETYRTVGERMGELHESILAMATKHVEERVACALMRLIQQGGRKDGNAVEISFPVTRQNISDMTGTTLHTVSRLLSAWARDGVVESRRRHIRILDPHRLVLLSGA
jgi:CRP-like cAMP-binding protein